MSGAELTAAVRVDLEPYRQEMVDMLGDLVRIESPSDDRPSLDRFADRLESLFGEVGSIDRIEPSDASRGRHLRLSIGGQDEARPHAVALCHYDTVWSLGTLPPSRKARR